ncbi:hypothetical protein SAMN05421770_1192 [Granulicella rosea]|uniref:N-terminal domain-containing protein n=2 Tax=Granulicella rosea TaxID=474952 RepID=A0A239MQT0_9BACT|nr:hypothetical protein SAMN05421770_1192 [Granulicella rosea]
MKRTGKRIRPAAVNPSNNSSQNPAPGVIATPHKQQTAKDAIAANIQLLIEQLEQGHSEGLTAYLTAMGRFRTYSSSNVLEIARQCPGAKRVAGMYMWNQLGRHVKKGEKGIRILAPILGARRNNDTEVDLHNKQDIRTQSQPVLVGFRAAYVFDQEQTTGADLPELSCEVTGDVGVYRERLIEFVLAQGISPGVQREHRPCFGHVLRRQNRPASRSVSGGGFQHPGS